MKNIKVIGMNKCKNCTSLKERIEKLIENNSLDAKVEKLTDPKEFMKYNILMPPGLVIDEKPVSSGTSLSDEELLKLIR